MEYVVQSTSSLIQVFWFNLLLCRILNFGWRSFSWEISLKNLWKHFLPSTSKEEHNFLRYKKVSKFHFQTKKNICELAMLIIAPVKTDGVHYYIPTVVWIWCLLVLLTICLKIFQNFFSELRILMIYHMEYPGDPVPGSAFSFLFRFALKD